MAWQLLTLFLPWSFWNKIRIEWPKIKRLIQSILIRLKDKIKRFQLKYPTKRPSVFKMETDWWIPGCGCFCAPCGTRQWSPASLWLWSLLGCDFCRVLLPHSSSPFLATLCFQFSQTYLLCKSSKVFLLFNARITHLPPFAHSDFMWHTSWAGPSAPPPSPPEASSWNLLPQAHSAPCTDYSCGVMRICLHVNVYVNMCVSQRNENSVRAGVPPSFQRWAWYSPGIRATNSFSENLRKRSPLLPEDSSACVRHLFTGSRASVLSGLHWWQDSCVGKQSGVVWNLS